MNGTQTGEGRCELSLAGQCADVLACLPPGVDAHLLEDRFVAHVERAAQTLPPEDTHLYWELLFSWLDQLAGATTTERTVAPVVAAGQK